MTYHAQDGFLDVIFGPIGGAITGAVGSKITGPEFYVGKTIELEVMVGQIKQFWPTSKVDYPVDGAIEITRSVTDALSDLNKQISKLVGRDLSLAGMHGLATHEASAYRAAVGQCISSAKSAGSPIARCPNLRSATITALSNIVGHYETLAKKEHELDSSILARTQENLQHIRQVMEAIWNNLPVPRSPFAGLGELVKWLTLAGVGGALVYFIWQQEKRR